MGSSAYFEGKREREAGELYWHETAAMLKSGLFTTIGHLDYIRSRWPEEYGPPGPLWPWGHMYFQPGDR